MDDLQAYHVVWCTHHSRYSEKLFRLKVKKGTPVILNDKLRNEVAESLALKIKTAGYKVIALNVLADHVHCIIVSSEPDLERIVGQLKGYSSYKLGSTGRLQPPATSRGESNPGRLQPPATSRGESNPGQLQPPAASRPNASISQPGVNKRVWAKKFSKTYIDSEEAIARTIRYVENNHLKHGIDPVAVPFSNWSNEDGSGTRTSGAATSIDDAFIDTAIVPRPTGGGLKAAVATPVEDGESRLNDNNISSNGAASAPRNI